mmetsp:Transcript_6344/g.9240  ORF Transcript_6344/g.9240 Transcript_6344/m.9240 type:complete len:717 (-) Transcript_6344:32-2182(-)
MGSVCSTTSNHIENPIEDGDQQILHYLCNLPKMYTTIKHVDGKTKKNYVVGCIAASNFKSIIFAVTDTREECYKFDIDIPHLTHIKQVIDVNNIMTWAQFFMEIKSSFFNQRIALEFENPNGASPNQRVCVFHLTFSNAQVLKSTIRLKLKWVGESPVTIISQIFVVPLYEHYSIRTEVSPQHRIEDLNRQYEVYKDELQYLETQQHSKENINKRNRSRRQGKHRSNGHQKNDKKRRSTTAANAGAPNQQSDKPPLKHSNSEQFSETGGSLTTQMQVAKFLEKLKKKLIQANSISETEHESLVAVINSLKADTIYQYELNNSQEKKIDLEVIAWLKSKFSVKEVKNDAHTPRSTASYTNSEEGSTSKKSFTSAVDRFVKNYDIKQINRTKTRQDIIAMFEKVNDWNFDVFKLRDLTDGQTLFVTAYTLFVKYDLLNKFNIPEAVLVGFLKEVQGGYHTNPYHNSMHAADVLQVFHFIVLKGGLGDYLTDANTFAGLIAAIIHDYDHPGLNNAFQVNTQSYLATLYNDKAVLENHHCAQAFELMRDKQFNILANITKKQYQEVRATTIDMVLATDMEQHSQIVGKFKMLIEKDVEFSSTDDISVALQIAIKIADTSNSVRPKKLYLKWAERIATEFYNQGDKERDLNLDISPFMDRENPSLASLQTAFISYLVIPMIDCYCTFLPKMDFCRVYVKRNKQYWTNHVQVDPQDLIDEDE